MEGRPDRRKDFAEFCGGWTEAQADEFYKAISDLKTIDSKDWLGALK